jgi:ABC-2 type transport system permease protein
MAGLETNLNRETSTKAPAAAVCPLWLLVRANLLQSWRKLKSVQSQSRLLSGFIGLFIVGYLAVSFFLFYRGLNFVGNFPGLGTLLTERLLSLLFAFLFVLLLFSNLVISYTNLFRNRETQFLMALPVSAQTIFQWKFIESTVLASWAFLFLIAPLLAAYGLTHGVPWHFYLVTVVLIALFIILPAVAGAWLAVMLARHLDRRVFQLLALGAAVVLLTSAAFWLKPEPLPPDMVETRVLAVLDRMLVKTRFAELAALPSYWLTAGVLNWADGAVAAAGFFALVLLSYALFFGFLMFTRMGKLYYAAASAVQSRESIFGQWEWFRAWRRRRGLFAYGAGPAERTMGAIRWLGPDVRALVVKDVRMFWRDTTQWGQTLVLFGLLGVYIINLRHFTHQLSNPFWVHLVSYLNLGACALNLATLTTRFVYPQFSLEGKRLWIVGMAPLGLVKVVKIKYWLASIASLALTLGLMWLSCWMLKMPFHRTAFFCVAISVMTFTLTGLAVGLGALYPNFKEDHPGKIVSGFGGTFCLVLSFLYIVASVILLAVGSPWSRLSVSALWAQWGCWVGFIALSLGLGWLPLKLGLERVAQFEL